MDTISLLHDKELSDASCGSESSCSEDPESAYNPSKMKAFTKSSQKYCISAVYMVLFIYFFSSLVLIIEFGFYKKNARDTLVPYSPASTAISYVIGNTHAVDEPEAFAGPPSDSSFKAWVNLIKPGLIRVSHEEMVLGKEHPENSTEVVGGGYMGSLGVYHELHCLRRMKLFLYKDHYYPGLEGSELAYEMNHLDHCLEAIRVSLMCAGNPALYTFQWVRNENRKPRTKTNSERVCVDWQKLEAWSTERSIGTSPALVPPPW